MAFVFKPNEKSSKTSTQKSSGEGIIPNALKWLVDAASKAKEKVGELPVYPTSGLFGFPEKGTPLSNSDLSWKEYMTSPETNIQLKELFEPKAFSGGRPGKAIASDIESAMMGLPMTAGATQTGKFVFSPKTASVAATGMTALQAGLTKLKGEEVKPEELIPTAALTFAMGGVQPKGGSSTIAKAEQAKKFTGMIDEVRGLLYGDDILKAKKVYQKVPKDIRPTFASLVDEIEGFRKAETSAADEVMAARFGDYQSDVNRMKKLLQIAGEKKSSETGLLFREHIPKGAQGQMSSDEIATALGMSENEFMSMLTSETTVGGDVPSTVKVPTYRAPTKEKPMKMPKDYKFGQPYSSVADPELLAKQKAKQREVEAKNAYKEWTKQLWAQEVTPTSEKIKDVTGMIKENTTSPLAKDIEQMSDITPLSRGWNTVYRNFKKAFGDKYKQAEEMIIDPFNKAKSNYVDTEGQMLDDLANNITRKYGFKKGSKESAAIQRYGERNTFFKEADKLRRQAMATPDADEAAKLRARADEIASNGMTKEDLIKEFGEAKANQIIEADSWFRNKYDEILPMVNSALSRIYPGNPDKLVPKREDYYRHFSELSGLKGLMNIFENPAGIEPALAGMSEYTKPQTKFMSMAQERLGLKPKEFDAIGGFIDYVPQAAYTQHISPEIGKFRNLRDELVKATSDSKNPASYKKLNNFIEFLDDYANDLAGKTNPMDRTLTKIGLTRKSLSVLNWINHRVKANTILGNLGASVAQIGNLPQAIASAGEGNFIKGAWKTVFGPLNKTAPMESSPFLKERYSYKKYRQFDTGMLDKAKDFTEWMTVVLDEFGTKITWNSHYEKALAENISNPIKYADDMSRNLVAGRGIGEVPLNQKSKLTQFLAPFQLEVANAWHVMKDFTTEKQFGKLAKFFIYSYLFNTMSEKLLGRRILLDPIDATIDAFDTAGGEIKGGGSIPMALFKGSGRIAGEALGNIPFGQGVAGVYEGLSKEHPDIFPSGKEFWGESDPTRYGGETLVARGLADPVYKLMFPFAGGQIKKTKTGAEAVKRGYSETDSGGMRFPISTDLDSTLQTLVFGEYSGENALFYFQNDLRPLSAEQLSKWKSSVKSGNDPEEAWVNIYKNRLGENLQKKITEVSNQKGVEAKEKTKQIKAIREEHKALIEKLNSFVDNSGSEKILELIPGGGQETPSLTNTSGRFKFTPSQ